MWTEKFQIFQTMNVDTILLDEEIPKNVRISCPSHLYDLMVEDYGEEIAFNLARQMNFEAPTFGRINPMKTNRDYLMRKLEEKKIRVYESDRTEFGIRFTKRYDFRSLDEFNNGLFEIQDESSQLTSSLVLANPGDQVMDYCAGSAGKTLAFAHRLEGKGQIYVCDVRKSVLLQARKRLKRSGIQNSQPLEIGKSPMFEKLNKKIDWLLLDVPCSGSGTLRRNPDAKYKIDKEWMEGLCTLQREIFDNAFKYLKDSGKIVYSTCSILKCENQKQIEYFVKKYNLKVERTLQNFPTSKGSMDGFFATVLSKK
jgi:16S rRNA (cytosine967-C5)-methyltransferase